MKYSSLQLFNKYVAFIGCFLIFAFAKAQQTPPTTAQDSTKTGVIIGDIDLPDPPSIVTLYTYDPDLDRYIYKSEFNGFQIGYPFMLTRDQYLDRVMKERMTQYFKIKRLLLLVKQKQIKKSKRTYYLIFTSIQTCLKVFLVVLRYR
ncbi:hypothetical protein LY02_00807 [Nonlabens ulvanivorans]|uniref:Uncharacterized protein n=1 Tax=Nonlabens ulvanivorans TaxID=906888 RepID=A0ABX5EAP8_NONUL|nr:hypothetical protein [Nonlabens ulvanivorans]PRX15587.1 hypothetical protein LY02_00807 [Nonlabens ulvanivorans]